MSEYEFVRWLSVSGVRCIENQWLLCASPPCAPTIEAGWPRRGTRLGAQHESAVTPQAADAQTSIEKLHQGNSQRSSSKSMSDEDAGKVFIEAQLKILDIRFGGQRGRVQFFKGFGDAFGLRAGKAALLELLDDAVGVDDEGGVGHSLYTAHCTMRGIVCKPHKKPALVEPVGRSPRPNTRRRISCPPDALLELGSRRREVANGERIIDERREMWHQVRIERTDQTCAIHTLTTLVNEQTQIGGVDAVGNYVHIGAGEAHMTLRGSGGFFVAVS
jgi:hypothetical protein